MDEKAMNFWQDHSIRFLESAFRMDKRGRVSNPDGYGRIVSDDCGDTVEYFLVVRNGRIESASMETDACLDTVACANAVACLAEGKTVQNAWEITPDTVREYLETLPPSKTHCAELALKAFYSALANLAEVRRNPWKKFYQNQ